MINIVRATDIITVKNSEFVKLTKKYDKEGWHLEQTDSNFYKRFTNNNYITFLLCFWK